MGERRLSPEALRKLRREIWPRGIVQSFTIGAPDKRLRSKDAVEAVPLDRMAARVVGRGEHWAPDMKLSGDVWGAPPKCKPVPPRIDDITGTRRGRMVIFGYWGARPKGGGHDHKWVARCDCGRYEVRVGSRFVKGVRQRTGDACQYCRKVMWIKRRDRWRDAGEPSRFIDDTELTPPGIDRTEPGTATSTKRATNQSGHDADGGHIHAAPDTQEGT